MQLKTSVLATPADCDLFARLIVRDDSIRRAKMDGVTWFARADILRLLADEDRKTDVIRWWSNLKRSARMRNMSLNLRHIHFGGRGRPTECIDYGGILYIAMSLPDEKANLLRAYVADRVARMSEAELRYLLRQQSEGKALAAEAIRYLYEIGYLSTPEPETPAEAIGLVYDTPRERRGRKRRK